MAIATDIEVNWVDTIDNTNKIGLSKTLNQLGANIFDSVDYCVGYNNKALKLTKESESYPKSTDSGANNVPFYISDNTGYTKNTANEPNGVYYRTILFAVPNNFTWGWDANVRSDNSIIRIVTKLNLQKNKLYLTTAETQKNALTTAPTYQVNESIEGTTANGTFLVNDVSYYINCADVYLTESGYYIKFQTYVDNMYDNFNPTYGEGILGNFNYDTNSSTMYSASPVMFANANYKVLIQGSEPNAYMVQNWNNTELDIAPDADNTDIKFFATYTIVNPYYWHTYLRYSVEYALWISASYGLMFEWNDVPYKPIIESGVLKGYTNDMTVPSDIDNWTDVSGHNISPTPPAPPTPPSSGDDMEAMATGATGSSGGFTHFYVMSSRDLIDFLADFYTRASSGETLTNNLVCSYILGIPSSEFCATEEVEIAIHNSAQGTPFVSKAKYSHITATNNLLVIGSFDVPRITNTFYDFAPYSTYEVFIPCCGWVALPDTVAGRRINVEMYIDIASCCLKAAVKTSDLGVCAVTNGVLGAAIPIAVIESGILRGNNIQAGLGIIGGGINTGIGAGSGNAMGIGFGVQQILNGLVECTIAGNTNYTQQKGGTGDITQFAMGHKCYMKVTHPEIDSVVNNSMFGHSVGYLCNSIGVLSGYTGFTVCGNPHVTFSASAEEREEIEKLLSMGVIL